MSWARHKISDACTPFYFERGESNYTRTAKAQNRLFLGYPTSKIFLTNFGCRNSHTPKISFGIVLIGVLRSVSEKDLFVLVYQKVTLINPPINCQKCNFLTLSGGVRGGGGLVHFWRNNKYFSKNFRLRRSEKCLKFFRACGAMRDSLRGLISITLCIEMVEKS